MKVSEARLRQLIANVLKEETHTFHGYKFGPDKMGLPGPQFDDESSVTADDVDDGKQWLDDNDPSELVAFSRGSAVLHQMMQDEPDSVPEVPTITYVSPAAMRDWTSAPVPGAPGGSKVVHSMGDNIVPLKQGCQVAAQSGADMYIAPGKADGKDHVRALKYRTGGGTKVDASACADDTELPDWGGTGSASDEELAQQVKRGKELVAEYFLREVIKESHFPLTGGEKVRIHHSRDDTRDDTGPQVSGFSQKVGYKPDGLWYECQDGSAINWLEFCRTGLTDGENRYDSSYNVVLNDYEILFITDVHDFKKFEKMYSTPITVNSRWGDLTDIKIDWPKVASHYDGIEICPYLYDMRKESDWYYGWDVASGCVWNASGIKELTKAGECNETRHHVKELLKESTEEIDKIMQIWDAGEWEQAQELAYMLGPEVSQHPDLKIWSIYNAEEGDLVIEEVNYDQAMDPKYQAFAAWTSGYIHTEYPDRKNNPWGNTINAASARKYPPGDLDFEEAADTMREEGWKAEVADVDEEIFAVMVKLVDV